MLNIFKQQINEHITTFVTALEKLSYNMYEGDSLNLYLPLDWYLNLEKTLEKIIKTENNDERDNYDEAIKVGFFIKKIANWTRNQDMRLAQVIKELSEFKWPNLPSRLDFLILNYLFYRNSTEWKKQLDEKDYQDLPKKLKSIIIEKQIAGLIIIASRLSEDVSKSLKTNFIKTARNEVFFQIFSKGIQSKGTRDRLEILQGQKINNYREHNIMQKKLIRISIQSKQIRDILKKINNNNTRSDDEDYLALKHIKYYFKYISDIFEHVFSLNFLFEKNLLSYAMRSYFAYQSGVDGETEIVTEDNTWKSILDNIKTEYNKIFIEETDQLFALKASLVKWLVPNINNDLNIETKREINKKKNAKVTWVQLTIHDIKRRFNQIIKDLYNTIDDIIRNIKKNSWQERINPVGIDFKNLNYKQLEYYYESLKETIDSSKDIIESTYEVVETKIKNEENYSSEWLLNWLFIYYLPGQTSVVSIIDKNHCDFWRLLDNTTDTSLNINEYKNSLDKTLDLFKTIKNFFIRTQDQVSIIIANPIFLGN